MNTHTGKKQQCPECEGIGKVQAVVCTSCEGAGEIIIHSHKHTHGDTVHDHPHSHTEGHHPEDDTGHEHRH